MAYRYEATQADPTTWKVKRTDEQGRVTESLLCELGRFMDQQKAIGLAVRRGSWA